MSDTNWPNPQQIGAPMFSERDGPHVIEVRSLEGSDLVYYWHQNGGGWTEYNYQGAEDFLTDDDMQGWIYKGPVLTPTQITEMLAGERERCVSAFAAHGERAELAYNGSTGDEEKQYWRGAINTFEECRDEIRHMGDLS